MKRTFHLALQNYSQTWSDRCNFANLINFRFLNECFALPSLFFFFLKKVFFYFVTMVRKKKISRIIPINLADINALNLALSLAKILVVLLLIICGNGVLQLCKIYWSISLKLWRINLSLLKLKEFNFANLLLRIEKENSDKFT